MNLLIDIGNTRIKWVTSCDLVLQKSDALFVKNYDAQTFVKQLGLQAHMIKKVLVSSVAHADFNNSISSALLEAGFSSPVFVQSERVAYGVKNAYLKPGSLGVDRWCALIAAFNEQRKHCCIIDCGTAITVDVLDESGEHRGGLITPGLGLMARSLVKAADQITFEMNPPTSVVGDLFANNSEHAINDGILLMVSCYIDSMISRAEKLFLSEVHCVLTGGDALAMQPLLSHASVYEADMVLKGLAVIGSNS